MRSRSCRLFENLTSWPFLPPPLNFYLEGGDVADQPEPPPPPLGVVPAPTANTGAFGACGRAPTTWVVVSPISAFFSS